jgi:hypothetical protein
MQQSDSEATFFGQLRHFGESTSVRGVPRALKSNDRVLAILWSLAVVLCAGLLLWQVSTVFIRYYQYNVVTSVTEANYETVRKKILP